MLHARNRRRRAGSTAAVALVASCAAAAPAARAVDFSLGWTGDFAAVADGGLRRGWDHLGLVEGVANSQFELPAGPSVRWHVAVQHTYGGGLSRRRVGDLQTVSNIDADRGTRLLEAWLETDVAPGWSVGGGKYDFNREFDVIESGGLFLSGTQGMGLDVSQSGTAGPSIFPHTTVGLRVEHRRSDAATWRAALLDADSIGPNRGGPMLGIEYEHTRESTRVVFGAWRYAGDKPAIRDPRDSCNEYGAYASAERHFADDVTAYLRIGVANPRVERTGAYVGGGIVSGRGLLPGREDSVGLAIGVARGSREYRDAMRANGIATDAAEYALEATWHVPFGEHFALQPDLQYVVHPGTDPSVADALVFILRVVASL